MKKSLAQRSGQDNSCLENSEVGTQRCSNKLVENNNHGSKMDLRSNGRKHFSESSSTKKWFMDSM